MGRILEIAAYALELPVEGLRVESVSGGCINECFRITSKSKEQYFLKVQSIERISLFDAEAQGLKELDNAGVVRDGSLRVPQLLSHGLWEGTGGSAAYLVMEYLQLRPLVGREFYSLGEALARLHSEASSSFGFSNDNFIGETSQPNSRESNWVTFYSDYRLAHQLRLAIKRGASSSFRQIVERVIANLPDLLANHEPKPSLLHGDLWSGNAACCLDGTPAIFDPAVYYGDRETDIAMTELFGGFTREFYLGYDSVWPLDERYVYRKSLYQLYHSMNHFNLFGGSYQQQAIGHAREALASLN